jgi:hypothetical protein
MFENIILKKINLFRLSIQKIETCFILFLLCLHRKFLDQESGFCSRLPLSEAPSSPGWSIIESGQKWIWYFQTWKLAAVRALISTYENEVSSQNHPHNTGLARYFHKEFSFIWVSLLSYWTNLPLWGFASYPLVSA